MQSKTQPTACFGLLASSESCFRPWIIQSLLRSHFTCVCTAANAQNQQSCWSVTLTSAVCQSRVIKGTNTPSGAWFATKQGVTSSQQQRRDDIQVCYAPEWQQQLPHCSNRLFAQRLTQKWLHNSNHAVAQTSSVSTNK